MLEAMILLTGGGRTIFLIVMGQVRILFQQLILTVMTKKGADRYKSRYYYNSLLVCSRKCEISLYFCCILPILNECGKNLTCLHSHFHTITRHGKLQCTPKGDNLGERATTRSKKGISLLSVGAGVKSRMSPET